ncbi:MAG: type II and III secretion system protein [Acidobacteriia bacterium]|nr:type II and III secretion system protein [Terriglobia bacterium]
MRRLAATLVLFCSAAWAQSAPQPANPDLEALKQCAQQRTPATCGVSKQELKQGQRDFARGLKLQKAGKSDEAFDAFDAAARVVPRNLEYATAREIIRQKLIYDHVQKGNSLLLEDKEIAAAAEFRQALQLDPNNSFALQQLAAAAAHKPPPGPHEFLVVDDPGELRLQPLNDSRHDFHFRGDTRALYQAIGKAFGVAPQFDETVVSRQVRFDLEDADFRTAMRVAGLMSKSSWTPLSAREFLVYADNAQNRAQFERLSLRTFFVPDAAAPQDLSEIVNVLRTVFEIRFITPQNATSTLVVRAPRPILDAATAFLAALDQSRPQVMLDFQVYEISRSLMRSFGLTMPLQWQTFSLNAAALAALQQPNVQDAINQLIASGGINAANTTAIAALLAQLQSQSQSPLLQQPFATFGGGQTLTALAVPPISVNFSRNESQVSSLQHMTLRASHGNAATMRIGARYPILNSTFAPIYNSPAIAQVIQNNSFIAPFPSFNFEDLGLLVKATPQIHGATDVRLELSVEVKALSAQSFNGVPVISNRAYTGTISIKDGEAGVIAGMLDVEEQNTLTGLPGVARLPLLGTLTSSHNPQKRSTELIILITPHLTRIREARPKTITIPSS